MFIFKKCTPEIRTLMLAYARIACLISRLSLDFYTWYMFQVSLFFLFFRKDAIQSTAQAQQPTSNKLDARLQLECALTFYIILPNQKGKTLTHIQESTLHFFLFAAPGVYLCRVFGSLLRSGLASQVNIIRGTRKERGGGILEGNFITRP